MGTEIRMPSEGNWFHVQEIPLNSAPKTEQLQAIHAVVTVNDVFVKTASRFGKSVY